MQELELFGLRVALASLHAGGESSGCRVDGGRAQSDEEPSHLLRVGASCTTQRSCTLSNLAYGRLTVHSS
jgi:hypothetical protein